MLWDLLYELDLPVARRKVKAHDGDVGGAEESLTRKLRSQAHYPDYAGGPSIMCPYKKEVGDLTVAVGNVMTAGAMGGKGPEPRNAGGLQKLKKARKQILC